MQSITKINYQMLKDHTALHTKRDVSQHSNDSMDIHRSIKMVHAQKSLRISVGS